VRNRKKEIGKRIARLMAECDITTRKQLADMITEEASKATPPEKGVTSTTVGRWISGEDEPKAGSLTFLARALKVSADLILFEDNPSSKQEESLRRVVAEVAQAEVKKLLAENSDLDAELVRFLKSEKIPQEDKNIILAQIRRLLKRYKETEDKP